MPALASPSTWRQSPYAAKYWLYVWNPAVVFQAQVTNVSNLKYPLTNVTVDTAIQGSSANVRPGMTAIFGSTAGGDDLGKTRVRSTVSGSTMPIGRTPQGRRLGEIDIQATTYVTVLDQRLVWAKIPKMNKKGKTWKDETAFNSGIAQPPIANGGPAVAGFVDPDTDTLTVDFNALNSVIVDASASILSYSWSFGSDATPTTSTSATPTAVFPAGPPRYVYLTVSDGTRTHTTAVVVYPAPRSGQYAPNQMAPDSFERTLTPQGQRLRFRINADMEAPPDDAVVLLFAEEYFGSSKGSIAGPTGRENVKFCGWISGTNEESRATAEGMDKRSSFEALDVGGRLAELPAFPQIVIRKQSPTKWEHMANANADRYIHYLLHWHSTALEVAPFQLSGTGSTYNFKTFSSDGGSLADQVNALAKAIKRVLTCDSHGILRVLPDPQRLNSGSRTSTVIVDLEPQDWSLVGREQNPYPRIHWLEGEGFIAGTGKPKPVLAIAPGKSPGQGVSSQKGKGMLLVDAADLTATLGHDYARLNTDEGTYSIALAHGGDAGIEPAHMEWVRLTISEAAAAYRGVAFTDARFLPLEVTFRHNAETGAQQQVLRLERETFGTTAQLERPPVNTLPPYIPPASIWQPPPIVVPPAPVPVKGSGTIAVIRPSDFRIARTADFNTPEAYGGPTWELVQIVNATSGTGAWLGWVTDAFSPGYQSPSYSGQINGWLVTTTGIYRVVDVFGTPTATLQHTFTTSSVNRTIQSERGAPGWAMVASYYGSSGGTTVTYTTDGGTTWTEVTVSSHYNTSGTSFNSVQIPTIAMSFRQPGVAWVGAFTATGSGNAATSALYKTTNYGANWALDPGRMSGRVNTGLSFHLPVHDNDGDRILYWSLTDFTSSLSNSISQYRTIGATQEDVHAPAPAGNGLAGARHWRGLDTSPLNRQLVVMAGFRRAGGDGWGAVYTSEDGGLNWTQRTEETINAGFRWERVFCAGNDPNVVYLLGEGRVGWSGNFCATIENRSGNLSGGGSLLAIIGGG